MKRLFKVLIMFVLVLAFVPFNSSITEAAAKSYTATVNITSGTLNVREKPSTSAKKIGYFNKGAKVSVYVKNKKGWATVRYKNKKGYVLAKYLKYSSQAASYDKAYAAESLVVKSSPGASYKTVGKIEVGTVVKVYGAVPIGKDQGNASTAEQYGWSKIKYKNKTAWVATYKLSFADPYKWTPGVKTKTINDIKKNYVSKNDKVKLEKSGLGYYAMYVQINGKGEWHYLVTINCKTGWYHG
ncbi:MAG TPA: cell division site-positioning protein MapZ family protein [Ureibacillus sp.]|nr:cell division site-positioning protein MapZ family protein [Ureibacillus sp.]